MSTLDLTIQVLHLSPKVTLTDLNTFFSYCGPIDKILLERKDDQSSQSAFVTFKQPYAVQTALLLNDVTIADRRVRILPMLNSESTPVSNDMNNGKKKKEKPGLIPVAQSAVQVIASKGYETLNKAKEELDEKGKVLTQRTRMAISTAEQTVAHVGGMVMSNQYVSAGAFWVSGVVDKATKCASQLGSHDKRKDPNSRKQK